MCVPHCSHVYNTKNSSKNNKITIKCYENVTNENPSDTRDTGG